MVQSLLSALLLGIVSSPSFLPASVVEVDKISVAPLAESLPVSRHLSASGVLVVDVSSGQRVFGKQVATERSMASLTKLMTALIIIENHTMGETVTIPEGVDEVIGNRAYLNPGEHFYLGDILSAMLIPSANDAARTLARYHSGTVEKFVEEMNARATSLGLKNTSFQNPDGLDGIAHYSTPQDIAWLTMYVLKQPEIAKRMATTGMRIYSFEGSEISLAHSHALLSRPEVIAGKTGTTDGAGECLVSVVRAHGKDYVVVLMNSLERYTDLQTILSALTENVPARVAATQGKNAEPNATQ